MTFGQHHFKVDPGKWDYYAMDVHRIAGDDDLAQQYASTVIADTLAPDGSELSPMRVSECRLTLGIVAARQGDLERGRPRPAGAHRQIPTRSDSRGVPRGVYAGAEEPTPRQLGLR